MLCKIFYQMYFTCCLYIGFFIWFFLLDNDMLLKYIYPFTKYFFLLFILLLFFYENNNLITIYF